MLIPKPKPNKKSEKKIKQNEMNVEGGEEREKMKCF